MEVDVTSLFTVVSNGKEITRAYNSMQKKDGYYFFSIHNLSEAKYLLFAFLF